MPYFLIAAMKKKTNTKNPNPNMVVLASKIELFLVLHWGIPSMRSLFKSQRFYFRISIVPMSIRPIFIYFFVAEVTSSYLTTDGLKKNSLLPEATPRPEARGICHICHMVNPALHQASVLHGIFDCTSTSAHT